MSALPLSRIVAVLAVGAAFAVAAGPASARAASAPVAGESRVEIRLVGGLTPWQSIRYEVFERDGVAVVVHERELAGRPETFSRTGLLTAEEHAALWKALTAADVLGLPRPARPALPGGPTATIEATHGGRSARVVVPGPLAQDDPRYAAVLDAVRRVVLERAGAIPFRDVFLPADALGWLDLTSTPAADVWLDGRATGERTPIARYELRAGRHEVVLRNETRGIERRYDFKIEPGMTTILKLELR